jgi:hypothetical protein
MRVTVVHHVNGTTKTAVLEASHISTQMVDGGLHVVLSDIIGGEVLGWAMFTAAGLVALGGVAVAQYGLAEPPPAGSALVDDIATSHARFGEATAACCGDPKNLDGNAHPWQHISEDGPGDVYRCPECGAVDVD